MWNKNERFGSVSIQFEPRMEKRTHTFAFVKGSRRDPLLLWFFPYLVHVRRVSFDFDVGWFGCSADGKVDDNYRFGGE